MLKTVYTAAAIAMTASTANADAFSESIIQNFVDLGYDFIEVKDGPGQIKVEAVRGTDKVEVIWDRATGAILKEERERADADDMGRSGLQVRRVDDDFLDGDRRRARSASSDDDDDDDGDRRRRGRDGRDDDDSEDSDRSGRRGGDDDRNNDRDDDDDDDDDDGDDDRDDDDDDDRDDDDDD